MDVKTWQAFSKGLSVNVGRLRHQGQFNIYVHYVQNVPQHLVTKNNHMFGAFANLACQNKWEACWNESPFLQVPCNWNVSNARFTGPWDILKTANGELLRYILSMVCVNTAAFKITSITKSAENCSGRLTNNCDLWTASSPRLGWAKMSQLRWNCAGKIVLKREEKGREGEYCSEGTQ